jgi:CheY-like chemotaxis protein
MDTTASSWRPGAALVKWRVLNWFLLAGAAAAGTTAYLTVGTSSAGRRSHPMPQRIRVLVVDDDLSCRVLASLLLENAGYSPTAVASVARALERLGDGGTDLVLTDLVMPGRGGLDLLESLRGRKYSPPALVMTGSDDEALVGRALELGARGVLRKPFSPELLRAGVRRALDDAHAPPAAA